MQPRSYGQLQLPCGYHGKRELPWSRTTSISMVRGQVHLKDAPIEHYRTLLTYHWSMCNTRCSLQPIAKLDTARFDFTCVLGGRRRVDLQGR